MLIHQSLFVNSQLLNLNSFLQANYFRNDKVKREFIVLLLVSYSRNFYFENPC